MRRRAVLLKHEMLAGLLSSDEFLEEDIVAAEFLCTLCPKKRPLFIFPITLSKKLTNFNDFCCVKS